MLAELETALVDLLRKSALVKRLAEIDVLPDLGADELVGRIAAKAPAVYVALGSFRVEKRYMQPKLGIACVAKNSRGHKAARHGDGQAIGLLEMIDAVLAVVDGCTLSLGADQASFEAVGVDMLTTDDLFKKGLYVAVVQIEATSALMLPPFVDEVSLKDFTTFAAAYDIEPHQPATEHAKWLKEPADYSTSKPELTDQLNPRNP